MPVFERPRLERSTFLVLFALAAYGFWRTIEPIWVPVLLGLVIAVGVYPLHEKLLKRIGGKHPGLPAALLTATVMILLLCVMAFLLLVVGSRGLDLAKAINLRYQNEGAEGLLGHDLSALLSRAGMQPASLGQRLGNA